MHEEEMVNAFRSVRRLLGAIRITEMIESS